MNKLILKLTLLSTMMSNSGGSISNYLIDKNIDISNNLISSKVLSINSNAKEKSFKNYFSESKSDLEQLLELKEKFQGLIISAKDKLTTRDTLNEALELIIAKLNYNQVTFEIDDSVDSDQELEEGNNEILVKMSLNDESCVLELIISDVLLLDEDRIDKIRDNLDNIDGAVLTTSSTSSEVLKLIQKNIKEIDKKVKIELANVDEGMKLSEGTNKIKILIVSGERKELMDVIINNVKKSAKDKLEEIIEFLNNYNFDGSNYETDDLLKNTLDLIQNKINEFNYNIKVKIVEPSKKLLENDNLITIELLLEKLTRKIDIKMINVKKSKQEQLTIMLNKIKPFDGSKFTTNQKIKDTLSFIKSEVKKLINKEFEYSQLDITSADEQKKLKVGDNEFIIIIKIDDQIISKKIKLIDVKLSDRDQLINIFNKIKNGNYDDSNLTTENTYKDALDFLKDKISISKEKNVEISLVDENELNKNLNENNELKIKIKINDEEKIIKVQIGNIKKTVNTKIDEIINTLNKNSESINSKFSSNKKVSLLFEELQKEVAKIDPDCKINIDKLVKNKLLRKFKEIKLELELDGQKKSFNYDLSSINLIDIHLYEDVLKISKNINATNFTTDSTQEDVSQQFQKDLGNLIKKYDLKFQVTGPNAGKTLKPNTDIVVVKVSKGPICVYFTLIVKNIVKSDDLQKLEQVTSKISKLEPVKVPITCLKQKNQVINYLFEQLLKENIVKDKNEIIIENVDELELTKKLKVGIKYSKALIIRIGKHEKKINIKYMPIAATDNEKCLV